VRPGPKSDRQKRLTVQMKKLQERLKRSQPYELIELTDDIIGIGDNIDPRKTRREFKDYIYSDEFGLVVYTYKPGGSIPDLSLVFKLSHNGSSLVTGDSEFLAAIHRVREVSKEKLSRRETNGILQLLKKAQCAYNNTALRVKVAEQLTNKEMSRGNEFNDKTVENVISILEGDVDDIESLILDLRFFNGKEGTKFEVFFENCMRVLRSDIGLGAEERRATGSVNETFACQVFSTRDLWQKARDMDESVPAPSISWLEKAFTPSNKIAAASARFMGHLPVQRAIQKRTLRKQHVDAKYGSVLSQYFKHNISESNNAVKELTEIHPEMIESLPPLEIAVTAVGVDDKCKIPCPRDIAQSTNVRANKKGIVADNLTLVACDHDYNSANITPAVTLFMNKPTDPKDSFYIGGESGNGRVQVTLRDSVFQASDVFDHMAQLCKSINDEVEKAKGDFPTIDNTKKLYPLKMSLQSDGGPDRNLTFLRTKLALFAAFKLLNLDILIATRCAPGQSYLNVAERAMSLLYIGLQHVAIKMGDIPLWLHEVLDKCPSMAETRVHCSKLICDVEKLLEQRSRTTNSSANQQSNTLSNWMPGMHLSALTTSDLRKRLCIHEEFRKGMDVPIAFLEERFLRLKAGGRAVEIKKPVASDNIDMLHNTLRDFDPSYNKTFRKSTDLKKMSKLDRLFQCRDHVLESPYCLQIRRCGRDCEFGCGALRSPAHLIPTTGKTLQETLTTFMPLPMRDEAATNEKYSLYNVARDVQYRSVASMPSLQKKDDKTSVKQSKKKIDTKRGSEVNKWNRNSVRSIINCSECGKQRCIFSKNSQPVDIKGQLEKYFEEMEYYICGDFLFPEPEEEQNANPLSSIFFNRINLTCSDHMEPEYYLTTNLNKEHMDECAYCLSHTDIFDDKELEQRKLLTGHKHLPICKACCEDGFKLPTYGLKNAADAAAQKKKIQETQTHCH